MELRVLIISALLTAVRAGPVDTIRDVCASKCSGTNKFGYRPGISYEFDYNSKMSTSLKGSSEGLSGLELNAKVHIEVVSRCDFLLRVDNVQLHETNPNDYQGMVLSAGSEQLRRALEHHNLRFSFQDGVVEELCPASGESIWALNIKRGMLSVFQNTMDDLNQDQRVRESDVTGNCDAEYTTRYTENNNRIIRKTKNLLGCTERSGYRTSIRGTSYRVPSGIAFCNDNSPNVWDETEVILNYFGCKWLFVACFKDFQTIPILKSEHVCQQEITNKGQLKTASCVESHLFRPFSREGSGAVTETKATMIFVRERASAASIGSISRKAGLVFEHFDDNGKHEKDNVDIERKLMEICENFKFDVRPNTPQLFTELVYIMKSARSTSLKLIYEKVNKGDLCPDNLQRIRKMFLDAIPMVGSSASLSLMTQFINDKTVAGVEADIWLTSLSFIQHPTKSMLKDVLLLLRGNNRKAMLPIASLVNSYCKDTVCENDTDVDNIILAMQSKIQSECLVDDNNLREVIVTLRAIGNAGHALGAVTTINSCLTNKSNPMDVRLAAVEAFRRMPCSANRSELVTLFVAKEEDSQLRIAAYLALMQCAEETVLSTIKDTLQTEEVNQVGSFVWSHLKNLMETSNPHKQEVRALLENEQLRKDFDLDKRKFSRNYEWSFFQEKLNVGAALESNLIWSPRSFIPRSATANLTVDLFGHSVNIFEIGGRVEGLEHFLESYLGPNGYFGDNFHNHGTTQQAVKGISSRKMKNIDRQFLTSVDKFKGAIYMRVFGNELDYKMFGGQESTLGDDFNILQMLITLSKHNDYTLSQSFMFMDSDIIVPTSSGFPLSLSVNGTATVDLKLSGKFDVRKMATSPRSVSIDGSIKPSAALQISSMMSVDAFVTKSGLKMVSTLHTSTDLQGRIELQNGRIFTSELDIPSQKIELFNLRTKFFTIHDNNEKEQQMITENRQRKIFCSGGKLATVVGLELCGELSFPNASLKTDAPYFPLTGPVSVDVELVKRDNHNKYKFQSRFTKSRDSDVMRVLFDTPESTVNRKMEIDVTLDKLQKSLKMALISPWKTALLSGTVKDEKNLKQLMGSFITDNVTKVGFLAEIRKSRNGTSYIYTSNFEVKIPYMSQISMTGSMEYQAMKLYDVNFVAVGLLSDPIILKGIIQNKKNVKVLECSISFQNRKWYNAVSRLQTSFTKMSSIIKPYVSIHTPYKEIMTFGGSVIYKKQKSLTIEMTLSKLTANDIKLFARIRRRSQMNNFRYHMHLQIKTPYLVTKLRSIVGFRGSKNTNIRTSLEYVIPQVFRDRLSFNGKIIAASSRGLKKIKGKLKLISRNMPSCNMDLDIDAINNQRKSEVGVTFNYGDNNSDKKKTVMFFSSLTHRLSWTSSNIALSSRFKHMGYGIEIEMDGNHSHDNTQMTNTINLVSNKKNLISTIIHLEDKLKEKAVDIKLAYPGRTIKLSNQLIQRETSEYSNTFSLQYQPGKKSVFSVSLRQPSKQIISVSLDINVQNLKRVSFFSEVHMNKVNFTSNTSFILGKNIYFIRTQGQIKAKIEQSFSSVVKLPSRRITVEFYNRYALPVLMGKVDVKWDADKDITKRFLLDYQASLESVNSIHVYFNQQSPIGTTRLDLKHRGGNIFVTNTVVEWGNFHRVTIDTTLSNKQNNIAHHIIGKLKITSPFRGYRNIDIDGNFQSNAQHIISHITLHWKPFKPYSIDLKVKRKLTWSSFDSYVVLNTPLKILKRSSIQIAHSFENNAVKTITKITRNRDMIQVIVDGTRKVFDSSCDMIVRINFKSSIDGFESIFINGRHFNDGSKYQNSFTVERNAEGIGYALEMLHYRTNWQIHNSGRVLLTLSSGEVSSEWYHENTNSQWNTSLLSHLGLHSLELKLNAEQNMNFEMGSASSSLHLGGSVMPKFDIAFSHEHATGTVHNFIEIKKENVNLFSINNDCHKQSGNFKFTHQLEIYEKLYLVELDSVFNIYPSIGNLKVQWSPDKFVTLKTIFNENDGLYIGHINLLSPIKSFENVNFQLNQSKNLKATITTVHLQYHPERTVSFKSIYQWETAKKIDLSLTPFSSLHSTKFSFDFTGDIRRFSANANIEVKPLLLKSSLSSQCNTIGNIFCKIEFNTPFQHFSNGKLEVSRTSEGHNQINNLIIKYQPAKTITFQTTHRLDHEDFMGSIVVTSPFVIAERVAATCVFTGNVQNFRTNIRFEGINNNFYEGNVHFLNQKQIIGEVTVKLADMDNIVARINHERKDLYYKMQGEFQYKTGRKIEIDTTFDGNEHLEWNLLIKSPFRNDVSVSAYHSGNFRRFETRANYQDGQQISQLRVNFVNEKSLECSVFVTTPTTNTITANIAHNGNRNHFLTKGELEYMPGRKIEIKMAFQNTDNLAATVLFLSPFTNLAEVSLEHTGRIFDFHTLLKIANRFGNKVNFQTQFTTKSKVEGKLKLQTPYTDDVLASVFHSFEATQLHSHVLFQYKPDRKFEGNVGFNTNKGIEGSIVFRTPYTQETIATFSHARHLPDTTSHIGIQYGYHKELQFDFSFRRGEKTMGSVLLKMPFTREKAASFYYIKNNNQYQTHIEATLQHEQKYEIDINCAINHQMKGSVVIKTPFWNIVKAAFSHKRHFTKFRTIINILYSNNKKIYSDIRFGLKPNKELIISMTTPFRGYNKLRFTTSHKGSRKAFAVKTMIARGKTAITSNFIFRKNPTIHCEFSILTPITGYRKFGALFTHSTTAASLKSRAEVAYGKNKNIVADFLVEKNPFTIAAVLETPLKGFESQKLLLASEGNVQNFRSLAEILWAKRKKVTITANLDTTSSVEAEIGFKSSFRQLEHFGLILSHTGSLQKFNSFAEISSGKRKIGGNLIFSSLESIGGSLTLKTPFRGYRFAKVTFSNDGTSNNFRSYAQLLYMGRNSEIDLTFSALNNIEGLLSIQSPYFSSIRSSFLHSTSRKRSTSHINAQYGNLELLDAHISFISRRKSVLSSSLRTLWTSEAEANVVLEGSLRKFQNKMSLIYANRNFKIETVFDSTNTLSGRLNAMIPIKGIESIWSSFTIKGRSFHLQTHFEGSINSRSIESDILWNFEGRKRGSFSLKTPFKSFRNINVNIIFDHQSLEINILKDHQIVKVNAEMSTENGVAATANLQTPWTDDMIAVISYSGTLNKFLSSLEITYSGKKQVSADISFDVTSVFFFKSSLFTPWRLLRNEQITIRHDGIFPNCNSFVELNINDAIFLGQMNLQTINQINGRLFLKTPYTRDALVKFTKESEQFLIKTKTEILVDNTKKISLTTEWELRSHLSGSVTLMTPFEGFENVFALLRLVDDRGGFRLDASLTYYLDQTIYINARLTQNEIQEGFLEIQSPFMANLQASFTYKGRAGLHLTMSISYGGQDVSSGKILVLRDGSIEVKLISKSAIKGLEIVGIHLKRFMDDNSYKCNGKLLVNRQIHTLDLELSNTVNKYITFNLNSPVTKTVSTAFTFRNANDTLVSSIESNFGDHLGSGEIKLNWKNKYDGFFRLTNVLSFFVEDANDVYGKFSHSTNPSHMKSFAELSYLPRQKFTAEFTLSGNDGGLHITTPVPGYEELSSRITSKKESDKRVNKAEIIFGTGKIIEIETSIDENEINVNIKTPFNHFESMSTSVRQTRISQGISYFAQIIDSKDQIYEAEFLLKALPETDGRVTIKTPFTGFEEMSFLIRRRWSQNLLTCHAEMTSNQGKIFESDISLNINNEFTGSFTLKTQIKGYEDLSAYVSHRHNIDSMYSNTHLQYATDKRIEIGIKVRNENNLFGELTLTTPFASYKQSRISFSYSSMDKKLHSVVALELEGEIKGSIDLAVTESAIIGLIVKTSLIGYELIEFHTTHTATLTGMINRAELQFNSQKANIEMTFAMTSAMNLAITCTMKTPFNGWETQSLSILHDGHLYDHQSNVELVFENYRIVAISSFKYSDELLAKASLLTPFSDAQHTEVYLFIRRSSAEAKIIYGNQQIIEADILFPLKERLEGSVTVKTPFLGYELFKSSFSCRTSDDGIKSHIELFENEQRTRAELLIGLSDNEVSLTTSLEIPFGTIKNIGLTFTGHGDLTNSKLELVTMCQNEEILAMSVKHIIDSNRIDHAIKITSTRFDDIKLSVYHNGNWNSFSTTAAFSFGVDSTHHNIISNINVGSVHFNYEATATVNGIHYISKSALSHEGQWREFKTRFVNELNGRQDVVLDISFVNSDIIEGTLILKTPVPHLRNIKMAFDYTGDISQFKTNGFFKYGLEKEILVAMDFFRYRLSRINANFKLKTPFQGFAVTAINLRHNVNKNGVKCLADISYGIQQKIKADLKFLWNPLSLEAAVKSPFPGFEEMSLNFKFKRQYLSTIIDIHVKYATGKVITFHSSLALNSKPVSLTVTLTTPFAGYESTEITYTYSGNIRDFRCNAELHASFTTSISGSLSYRYITPSNFNIMFSFLSPFNGFEMFNFQIRNEIIQSKFHSHSEVSWSVTDKVALDMSLNRNDDLDTKSLEVGVELTSPFKLIRAMSLKTHHRRSSSTCFEAAVVEHNSVKLIDVEIELGNIRSYTVSVLMREPQSVSFSINVKQNGTILDKEINKDLGNRTALSINDLSLKFIHPEKTIEVTGTFSKTNHRQTATGIIRIDGSRMFGFGCEFMSNYKHSSNAVILYLPSRSIKLYRTLREDDDTRLFETWFLWDAERDTSKKVGITANLQPKDKSIQAKFSLTVGKDVQMASEITYNTENIYLEGKTEIKYSEDANKTLVMYSRVEELSQELGKNTSLLLGLIHQPSTLDVQVVSYVGHVSETYTAGVDIQYMTTKHNRCSTRLLGEIDSLRKQIRIDVTTPYKAIVLTGNTNTSDEIQYRLYLKENHENKFLGSLLLDKTHRNLDIKMKYYLENTTKALNVFAGYLNDSEIKAEVYHQENSKKTTDSLLAIRLNSSRVLHTRLHWNPSILADIKNAGLRQMDINSRSLEATIKDITDFLDKELSFKYNVLRGEVIGEMQHFVDLLELIIKDFLQSVNHSRQTLHIFRERNYIIPEILGSISLKTLDDIANFLAKMRVNVDSMLKYLTDSRRENVDFPMKGRYERYIKEIVNTIHIMDRGSKDFYEQSFDNMDTFVGEVSHTSMQMLKDYQKFVTEICAQTLEMLKAKYSRCLDYVHNMPLPNSVTCLAQQYVSFLKDVKENFHGHLSEISTLPAIQLIHSQGKEVYQLGSSAFKFWEVEKNAKALMQKIYKYVIEEEIGKFKNTTIHFRNPKVTLLDPANGEFQMEVYLPVSMQSLRVLPKVEVARQLNRIKSYIPDFSKFALLKYLPDRDMANNLPPFQAHAVVSATRFTTFDGRTYNFNGRCSYVLTKDFANGKFSVILSSMEQQKRKLILECGKNIIQLLPTGNVRVDKTLVKTPYKSKDVSIVHEGKFVTIRGHGFTVLYDDSNDTFRFILSGWLHGKTGGLLGTFDNEWYNDITTSSNQLVWDISVFANTWEVDENC